MRAAVLAAGRPAASPSVSPPHTGGPRPPALPSPGRAAPSPSHLQVARLVLHGQQVLVGRAVEHGRTRRAHARVEQVAHEHVGQAVVGLRQRRRCRDAGSGGQGQGQAIRVRRPVSALCNKGGRCSSCMRHAACLILVMTRQAAAPRPAPPTCTMLGCDSADRIAISWAFFITIFSFLPSSHTTWAGRQGRRACTAGQQQARRGASRTAGGIRSCVHRGHGLGLGLGLGGSRAPHSFPQPGLATSRQVHNMHPEW